MIIDKSNKSFCAIPFVSIMVNTDTTVRYCCMVKGTANKIKKSDGTFYTCRDNFIRDAWNSDDLRQIRMGMINGEKISGCQVCYLQEDAGRTSNRQHSINEWTSRLGHDKLSEIIEQAKNNGGYLTNDIVYLDLRLGNLCNLKCRMCNPWNSSQIAKEHIELDQKNQDYSQVWSKTFGKFPMSVLDEQQWFDSDIMWDQVNSLIPTLKKVYMTGGEPTLIKNNFKFMQQCIDQKRNDITLFFNTNCTNVNKTFINLIKQFERVYINASLDGIGVVNDYIRAPSKWEQLSENIEKLAELPNVILGVTPTVQIYNVFDVVNILKWVNGLNAKYSRNIFIDFLINIHPHHLNIDILSDDIKQAALVEIENFLSANTIQFPSMTENSLKGIRGLLKMPRNENWQEQLTRFKAYTLALDQERNQSFRQLDNRLWTLLDD